MSKEIPAWNTEKTLNGDYAATQWSIDPPRIPPLAFATAQQVSIDNRYTTGELSLRDRVISRAANILLQNHTYRSVHGYRQDTGITNPLICADRKEYEEAILERMPHSETFANAAKHHAQAHRWRSNLAIALAAIGGLMILAYWLSPMAFPMRFMSFVGGCALLLPALLARIASYSHVIIHHTAYAWEDDFISERHLNDERIPFAVWNCAADVQRQLPYSDEIYLKIRYVVQYNKPTDAKRCRHLYEWGILLLVDASGDELVLAVWNNHKEPTFA